MNIANDDCIFEEFQELINNKHTDHDIIAFAT